ncbi:MAG TPA: hypothetical protein VFE47_14695 [Tepidisphaeraceae bacterium]|nr:hypothetical protein [Tepidisphaeraceae bacterium]
MKSVVNIHQLSCYNYRREIRELAMAGNLEKRVAALERRLAALEQARTLVPPTDRSWVEDLYGKFAGDPIFAEAMKLGRKYRESTRPRCRSRRKL